MAKLTIKNTQSLTTNFLNTIGRVSDDCIIEVQDSKIKCLCSTSDATLIQYTRCDIESEHGHILNVPDVKRLTKLISCIPLNTCELDVSDNSLSYNSSDIRFKYHLLDDGILSVPGISVEKIKQLKFDVAFELPYYKLTELIKGSTLANDVEKIYIYTDDNGHVYGELTDRQKPNMDSFCVQISDKLSVGGLIKPTPFNFENLRIISGTRCDRLIIQLNTELNVARVDIKDEHVNITYIVSALMS